MNDTQNLQQQIDELKQQVERLLSPVDFPLEFKNALIKQGFLKYREDLFYEGGAGGNLFANIIVNYNDKTSVISITSVPKTFTVNTATDVITCPAHVFSNGDIISFYTTKDLPAGLDNTGATYEVTNATDGTFKTSIDGGATNVNITTVGEGTHYVIQI